jgi:hypothetical protein
VGDSIGESKTFSWCIVFMLHELLLVIRNFCSFSFTFCSVFWVLLFICFHLGASCLVVVVDDQSLCTTLKHMMWWKWATPSTPSASPVRYHPPVELQCFLWNKQGCITSFAPSLAIVKPVWSLQSMSSSCCWCCCSSP